jgi:hypothetical protein
VNYFKGSGACGLSASPLYKNIDTSFTKEVLNKYKQTHLDNVKSSTQNINKQRSIIFTD